MPQLLGDHTANAFRDVGPAVTPPVTSEMWSEELRIEPGGLLAQGIVSDRGAVFTGEFLRETAGHKSLTKIATTSCRPRVKCHICIVGAQRRVRKRGSFLAFAVQAMGPSSDEDDTTQPWTERVEKPGELRDVVIAVDHGRPGSWV
jgi:hypothetical protein